MYYLGKLVDDDAGRNEPSEATAGEEGAADGDAVEKIAKEVADKDTEGKRRLFDRGGDLVLHLGVDHCRFLI